MIDPSPAPGLLGPDSLQPLLHRIQQWLDEAQRAGESVALLLVHAAAIDRIDAVQGFVAGNEMALNIAQALNGHLRKRDVVEPVSRGQFACILRPAPSEGIAVLGANRVLTLLAEPMQLDGNAVNADAAVGIAMFPHHAKTAGELLQRAKHAGQEARGRPDRIAIYSERDGEHSSTDPRQYENNLRAAIDQNRLSLHFQPQIDLRTRRIIGAESLLRWHDPVLGFVPPNIAVQAAESSGQIDRLTMWVITSAIQHAAEFQAIDPSFQISINISPSNLREVDLPYYLDRALRTWNVRGSSIVVEITETAMMMDQASAHQALRQLKTHGVKLSVDDFGTGYSSMYYLAQLPLDELKIDLMFVKSMLEVPQHAKIVRSLIDLAHNLELGVVAEGVENGEILAALDHLGCDTAQGYHIGKPVQADELMQRLQSAR